MSTIYGIQNMQNPLMAGGKVAGNAGIAGQNEGMATSFKDLLNNAISNVETLNNVKSQDSYNLAMGDVDDLSQIMVNSEKAEVAFQLFVQVRNKLLDGYSEIMRMNV